MSVRLLLSLESAQTMDIPCNCTKEEVYPRMNWRNELLIKRYNQNIKCALKSLYLEDTSNIKTTNEAEHYVEQLSEKLCIMLVGIALSIRNCTEKIIEQVRNGGLCIVLKLERGINSGFPFGESVADHGVDRFICAIRKLRIYSEKHVDRPFCAIGIGSLGNFQSSLTGEKPVSFGKK